MINANTLWLFLFIYIFLSIIFYFSSGTFIFYNSNKTKFSFTKNFPYEFFENNLSKKNVITKTSLICFACASFAPFLSILPKCSMFGDLCGLVIIVSIISIITGIFFVIISLVPVRFASQHILFSTIYLTLMIIFSGCISIISFIIGVNMEATIKIPQIIYGSISALLAICMLLTILNPKLKKWEKLDCIKQDDGTITYQRPKWFPLAYSEWIAVIINSLSLILFMLTIINF